MKTVVLSAGGTGGHLFPAQALAEELVRRGNNIVVMTDGRGANFTRAFPGAEIETVPAATFAGKGLGLKILAAIEIGIGVIAASLKLARIKPAAVIGFGGYPSLPVMLAASFSHLPTAILEQNTVLGRVNRLVANRVRIVAAAFPIARFAPRDTSKIVMTGNPVRPEVLEAANIPYRAPALDGPLCILVFGGSQGARALSEVVPQAVALLKPDIRARLSIVQQCRPEDLEKVRAVYEEAKIEAELASFFSDLPRRIAAAHLVIARAGAGTLAELAAIGRPAILIPLPGATDDHQTPNADVFANAGAGWRVPQDQLTPQFLAAMLEQAFSLPEDLAKRAAAARTLARPDAAQRLADVIEKLEKAA
ncbi:MAG TPA: undecaprenyldiphospho-muramoylpentapeptide beta-N-acetylglucosaminyltransferase [Rhizomicrobium sp.]|nr:undecaprenyldiphospho-muramoylpentapeptide beta-N-acetylglucosaminyltransferase [Rhizomicrobium sp.]